MREQPETLQTFKELLHTLPDGAIITKYSALESCLRNNNNEDKPSTKDILDAVKKIGTATDSNSTNTSYIMSSLIETYLKNKTIKEEQNLMLGNPIENAPKIFANPRSFFGNQVEATKNLIQNFGGLMSGLGPESAFMNKILEQIPPNDSIKEHKTKILEAYLENHNVTYDEFKNLLKFHQIDDPQLQTRMLVSYLKRSNLDESNFVKTVNDFSQDKDKLSQENKAKILEEYLVSKENKVTEDKVSDLADKIGLELFSNQIISFVKTKGTEVKEQFNADYQENSIASIDIIKYLNRKNKSDPIPLEDVVNTVNSRISERRPSTDVVAALSSISGANPLNEEGIGNRS